MKAKKTKRANLEKNKSTYFLVGMIISLSLVLISFEWTTPENDASQIASVRESSLDTDIIISTKRERPEPPEQAKLPEVRKIIDIVGNDVELEDVNWDDLEPDPGHEIIIWVSHGDDDDDPVKKDTHHIVEFMPTFNGGEAATEFMKYIARNLRYPQEAAANGIRGRVIVNFVIDEKGNLVEAKIIKGVHPDLDEEALRVLRLSPQWEPGLQQGRFVRVMFSFPINFILQ